MHDEHCGVGVDLECEVIYEVECVHELDVAKDEMDVMVEFFLTHYFGHDLVQVEVGEEERD